MTPRYFTINIFPTILRFLIVQAHNMDLSIIFILGSQFKDRFSILIHGFVIQSSSLTNRVVSYVNCDIMTSWLENLRLENLDMEELGRNDSLDWSWLSSRGLSNACVAILCDMQSFLDCLLSWCNVSTSHRNGLEI